VPLTMTNHLPLKVAESFFHGISRLSTEYTTDLTILPLYYHSALLLLGLSGFDNMRILIQRNCESGA
jgi:hypothetical protein